MKNKNIKYLRIIIIIKKYNFSSRFASKWPPTNVSDLKTTNHVTDIRNFSEVAEEHTDMNNRGTEMVSCIGRSKFTSEYNKYNCVILSRRSVVQCYMHVI